MDIPNQFKVILNELGYKTLYPPQEEAIKRGLLDGKNILVTTPTASGKTLIAMLAAANTILNRNAKVIYLTPLRALASEKFTEFKMFENMTKSDGKKVKVMVTTGDYDSTSERLKNADVIIMTNEKMDSVMRHGIDWIDEVGLFVVDEMHLLGDKDRGPTLEMMFTKIRMFQNNAQLLALSATVTNVDEIASWLGCELINSNWRPTELIEGVYDYGSVKLNSGDVINVENTTKGPVVDLVIDSIKNGGQVLVFAETRKRAISLAVKASELVKLFLNDEEKMIVEKKANDLLNGDETELTHTLAQLVKNGVAFHHAGLNPSSRKIVEDVFRSGLIKVITATPTLAAGVNLPARRVVISSITRYDYECGASIPISVLEYKQLCGRAGRPQYDTYGEAITIAPNANTEEFFEHYVYGKPEPIRSKLINEKALRVHLLSTIASLPGIKKEEIDVLFSNTLLAKQYRKSTISTKLESTLDYLELEMMVKRRGQRFSASEFGTRISLLYIDPATAVEFKRAITGAKDNGKHTLGFLHIVTDCTDFYPKLQLRNKDVDEVRMLIDEYEHELLFDLNEYDCSRSLLALYSWIQEYTDKKILELFGVDPGDMYRIVETSDWLLYSLYEVAKLVKREDLLHQIHTLRKRVKYGIKEELIPIVSLENIGRIRARALYRAGYKDIKSIRDMPVEKLATVQKIGNTLAKKIKEQLKKV
ncbi:MAG: RNA helicase [Thaumarchaeota archaeon]|nr:RNA helicase [Nitrososphaerota archaeon]